MKMPKGSKVAVDQSLLVAHPRVQGQKLCVVDTILLCLARSLTERRPLKECYHWAGYIPYNELEYLLSMIQVAFTVFQHL